MSLDDNNTNNDSISAAFSQMRISTRGELFSRIESIASSDEISDTKSLCYCYMLNRDANGQFRLKDLIEYIRTKLLEYSIPKSDIEKAQKYFIETQSPAKIIELDMKARSLYTELEKTGEGGEILLYILVQEVLKFPQFLSKMSLKTSSKLHYHGADGIHFNIDIESQKLDLYWCESKMYTDVSRAIKECFDSIANFLLDPLGASSAQERDLQLITYSISKEINNALLEAFLVRFFDKDDNFSNSLEYKGICFIGFDSATYPKETDIEDIHSEIREKMQNNYEEWKCKLSKRIYHKRLNMKEMHIFLLPLPSVEEFRDYFLKTVKL